MGSDDETSPLLETKHAHGVIELRLNRPHARNALNEKLYTLLAARLRYHNKRTSTRIIVLTGGGTTFCGGMDIKEALEAKQARRTIKASRGFMSALVGCDKIVLAGVHGHVVGIGVTMLLHCDWVVAGDEATFETPFGKVGIVPEFGSSVLFPRVLGLELANGMLLRGERVDAERMERAGVLRRVGGGEVREKVVEEAVRWSGGVGREEWGVVLEAKRLVRMGVRGEMREVLEREFEAIDRLVGDGVTGRLMGRRVGEMRGRKARL